MQLRSLTWVTFVFVVFGLVTIAHAQNVTAPDPILPIGCTPSTMATCVPHLTGDQPFTLSLNLPKQFTDADCGGPNGYNMPNPTPYLYPGDTTAVNHLWCPQTFTDFGNLLRNQTFNSVPLLPGDIIALQPQSTGVIYTSGAQWGNCANQTARNSYTTYANGTKQPNPCDLLLPPQYNPKHKVSYVITRAYAQLPSRGQRIPPTHPDGTGGDPRLALIRPVGLNSEIAVGQYANNWWFEGLEVFTYSTQRYAVAGPPPATRQRGYTFNIVGHSGGGGTAYRDLYATTGSTVDYIGNFAQMPQDHSGMAQTMTPQTLQVPSSNNTVTIMAQDSHACDNVTVTCASVNSDSPTIVSFGYGIVINSTAVSNVACPSWMTGTCQNITMNLTVNADAIPPLYITMPGGTIGSVPAGFTPLRVPLLRTNRSGHGYRDEYLIPMQRPMELRYPGQPEITSIHNYTYGSYRSCAAGGATGDPIIVFTIPSPTTPTTSCQATPTPQNIQFCTANTHFLSAPGGLKTTSVAIGSGGANPWWLPTAFLGGNTTDTEADFTISGNCANSIYGRLQTRNTSVIVPGSSGSAPLIPAYDFSQSMISLPSGNTTSWIQSVSCPYWVKGETYTCTVVGHNTQWTTATQFRTIALTVPDSGSGHDDVQITSQTVTDATHATLIFKVDYDAAAGADHITWSHVDIHGSVAQQVKTPSGVWEPEYGFPQQGCNNGFSYDGSYIQLVDSNVHDCFTEGGESHATNAVIGPGPGLFDNVFLSGSTINELTAGAAASTVAPNMHIADYVYRHVISWNDDTKYYATTMRQQFQPGWNPAPWPGWIPPPGYQRTDGVTNYWLTLDGSGHVNGSEDRMVPALTGFHFCPNYIFVYPGSGANATAQIDGSGHVTAINMGSQGNYYGGAPPVIITDHGEGATPATAHAIVSPRGWITAVVVDTPGSGYTSAPTIRFQVTGSGVTGASCTVDANGGLHFMPIPANGGSNYNIPPGMQMYAFFGWMKNLFEFKSMRRALVYGSVMSNVWGVGAESQNASNVLLSPKSGHQGNFLNRLEDITFKDDWLDRGWQAITFYNVTNMCYNAPTLPHYLASPDLCSTPWSNTGSWPVPFGVLDGSALGLAGATAANYEWDNILITPRDVSDDLKYLSPNMNYEVGAPQFFSGVGGTMGMKLRHITGWKAYGTGNTTAYSVGLGEGSGFGTGGSYTVQTPAYSGNRDAFILDNVWQCQPSAQYLFSWGTIQNTLACPTNATDPDYGSGRCDGPGGVAWQRRYFGNVHYNNQCATTGTVDWTNGNTINPPSHIPGNVTLITPSPTFANIHSYAPPTNPGDFTLTSPLPGSLYVSNDGKTPGVNMAELRAALSPTGVAPPLYTISGTITGPVVSNIVITINGLGQTTTDASGHYSFADLVAGTYTIEPTLPGYYFTPADHVVTVSSANVPGQDFTVAQLPAIYSISGTISGYLSSGVTVNLSGLATATTTTDASGNYAFQNLTNGNYTVVPTAPATAFTPPTRAVKINNDNLTGNDFSSAQAPTFAISGTVSGAVQAGVTITLTQGGTTIGTQTTDASGNYSFGGNVAGTYGLIPSLTAYVFNPPTRSVTLSATASSANNFTATSIQLPSLSGHVFGAEVNGVTIRATPSGGTALTTTTDSTGDYTFGEIPGGQYTAGASLTGYSFYPYHNFQLVGKMVRDFTSSSTGYSIGGTIRNPTTGVPVSGVTVNLALTSNGANAGTTTTDANGRYVFLNKGVVWYSVTPSLANYSFTPTSATANTNAPIANFDAASTTAAYTISGTLTGDLVAGASIQLSGDATGQTDTDELGNYSFEDQKPGDYDVTPVAAGYTFTPQSVHVTITNTDATGHDFTSALTVIPTYTISGTISGAVQAGVTVTADGRSAVSDSSGNYTIDGLANGSYTVTPTLGGYTFSPASRPVTIADSNQSGQSFTSSQVSGTGLSLTGSVADGYLGTPVSGITVQLRTLGNEIVDATTTDASGVFRFDNASAGQYNVYLFRTGYSVFPSPQGVYINASNPNQVWPNPFRAYLTSQLYTIGVVISGGPANVLINFIGPRNTTVLSTGANGNANLMPNGTYIITPQAGGYTFSPSSQTITVNGATISLPQPFVATAVGTTYRITGRISGDLTSNVDVDLTGLSTGSVASDQFGNYTFASLLNGSYTVTPHQDGYSFTPSSIPVTISGADVTSQNFTASVISGPTHTISGTISGAVSSGVSVVLSGTTTGQTFTDASGHYSFTSRPAGSYTVTPTLAGYTFSPVSHDVTVSTLDVTAQDFTSTAVVTPPPTGATLNVGHIGPPTTRKAQPKQKKQPQPQH